MFGIATGVLAARLLGPGWTDDALAAIVESRRPEFEAAGCTIRRIEDDAELCRVTAEHIAEGRVVGWFQGRMEWGPRALGNRSILGDPRRADMKDILNLKIKRRESFRPFAPAILREAVPAWFETDDDVPFMLQVYQIRPEQRSRIPAVTHVNGSGRLQTVTREVNGRYHGVIEAFGELTGVPVVLNTSFNENEPVVCRPEEAIDCFLRTRMDVLVVGDVVVERGAGWTTASARMNIARTRPLAERLVLPLLLCAERDRRPQSRRRAWMRMGPDQSQAPGAVLVAMS